jgi:hypothetical protein
VLRFGLLHLGLSCIVASQKKVADYLSKHGIMWMSGTAKRSAMMQTNTSFTGGPDAELLHGGGLDFRECRSPRDCDSGHGAMRAAGSDVRNVHFPRPP